ncbi:MAG TPA: phosphoenolpyruvate--protein phosphotransferase [Bacillales bacterium]|nr:phosphoenolpyruvate--protein phosphotransferase [Bacillales bacterium]
MSIHLKGIATSRGIAFARVFLMKNPEIDIPLDPAEDASQEQKRLEQAVEISGRELEEIKTYTKKSLGEDKAEIFSAHLLVLRDPEWLGQVQEKIEHEKMKAERALHEVTNGFVAIFENMGNEYMRERAADIRDISKRVLSHLLGVEFSNPALITEEVIVIAEDLTPSDTAQLNREFVKGFTTDIGGRTSHSAIMARSLEIPAVVGTTNVTTSVENGMLAIVDGNEGIVIVDPTKEEIEQYELKQKAQLESEQQLQQIVNEPTVTSDGKHVELAANIGSPADLDHVLSNGAEGVGLYRTEFLYMGREQLPSEEEQFEAYKIVLEQMDDKPVIIRTLDIGGDKELPYLELPEELNPFLGVRAIRLCFKHEEIFRTQLRALLRASVYGNLRVMFPMIATINEFKQAKQILLEEKEKLLTKGIEVSETLEIGMMVEIPAAAVMAKQFAEEVDFFSIGTNDLIQYTMAADRMNETVSYLYQPYSPAILSLIEHVITCAHEQGKWVGMCGEMAGEATALPLLLGLGLDEFSMSASSILPARDQMLQLESTICEAHARKALTLSGSDAVVQYMKSL